MAGLLARCPQFLLDALNFFLSKKVFLRSVSPSLLKVQNSMWVFFFFS